MDLLPLWAFSIFLSMSCHLSAGFSTSEIMQEESISKTS